MSENHGMSIGLFVSVAESANEMRVVRDAATGRARATAVDVALCLRWAAPSRGKLLIRNVSFSLILIRNHASAPSKNGSCIVAGVVSTRECDRHHRLSEYMFARPVWGCDRGPSPSFGINGGLWPGSFPLW